jgi:hypothetical protein
VKTYKPRRYRIVVDHRSYADPIYYVDRYDGWWHGWQLVDYFFSLEEAEDGAHRAAKAHKEKWERQQKGREMIDLGKLP